MEIKSTASMSINKLNVLAYGFPGSGKTHLLGTAARRFKTIVASAESGLLSLTNIKNEQGQIIPVDYVQIDKFEDLEEFARFLINSNHEYRCVGLDSGTEIQQVCMDFILRKEGRDKPQLQDWGTLNNKMTRMVRYFRDMSQMNVIVTALADESKQDDTTTLIKPLFQGKLQQSIAGYFDIVCYSMAKTLNVGAENEETKNVLICGSHEKLLTKDRSSRLPRVIPNDFGLMYDTIFNQ